MKNFIQPGDVITITPTIAVASGVGYLAGAALFGIATGDVAANTPGEFKTSGVFDYPKTAGLAIAQGDRLFWDPTNKVLNKTLTAQQCVAVAAAAAAAGAATVSAKLGAMPATAA